VLIVAEVPIRLPTDVPCAPVPLCLCAAPPFPLSLHSAHRHVVGPQTAELPALAVGQPVHWRLCAASAPARHSVGDRILVDRLSAQMVQYRRPPHEYAHMALCPVHCTAVRCARLAPTVLTYRSPLCLSAVVCAVESKAPFAAAPSAFGVSASTSLAPAAAAAAATRRAASASASASAFAPVHVRDNPAISEADRAIRHAQTAYLSGADVAAKRAEIRRYFHATFDVYERLFDLLKKDSEKAFTMRADRLRHPLIFYLGHTATFFINKLRVVRLHTH
jgi:hypothetical protein